MYITSSFCIRRRQENEYLKFVAGVTRDILARGVLSDLAMALLFQSHIERHRHRLRVVSWQTLPCPRYEAFPNSSHWHATNWSR